MTKRSKRIELNDVDKLTFINKETIRLYKRYEMDMSLRGLSPNTIYNYKTDLYAWFIYILDNQGNECITHLDEDDISEFFFFCQQQGNNTGRIKRRMASISAFYKYLRKKRQIQENPMEFIDRPKRDVKIVKQTYLTEEQVTQLKEKLIENGDLQLQTYVILSLSTMARVNAISNITWEQIDFDERLIRNVIEKEQREVDLMFSDECKELLLKLREERKENGIDCKYVFATNYKGWDKVSKVTMAEWATKAGKLIGLESFHPHDFRHSSATILKNKGMPLEDISVALNHLSTDVTQKFYIKEDMRKLRDRLDKFSF